MKNSLLHQVKGTNGNNTLKVNEIFKSIQGESTYSGLPCAFIRLTGCNLRCDYCDTTYAYDKGREFLINDLLKEIEKLNCTLVEVTGGEPLLQKNVFGLFDQLVSKNYFVLLETNGTVSLKNVNPSVIKIMDIKCPGSGFFDNTDWRNLEYLSSKDQIKFVISSRGDFDWAVKVIKEKDLEKLCTILFSPNHNRLKSKDLANWILEENINARFQLQLHKYVCEENIKAI